MRTRGTAQEQVALGVFVCHPRAHDPVFSCKPLFLPHQPVPIQEGGGSLMGWWALALSKASLAGPLPAAWSATCSSSPDPHCPVCSTSNGRTSSPSASRPTTAKGAPAATRAANSGNAGARGGEKLRHGKMSPHALQRPWNTRGGRKECNGMLLCAFRPWEV